MKKILFAILFTTILFIDNSINNEAKSAPLLTSEEKDALFIDDTPHNIEYRMTKKEAKALEKEAQNLEKNRLKEAKKIQEEKIRQEKEEYKRLKEEIKKIKKENKGKSQPDEAILEEKDKQNSEKALKKAEDRQIKEAKKQAKEEAKQIKQQEKEEEIISKKEAKEAKKAKKQAVDDIEVSDIKEETIEEQEPKEVIEDKKEEVEKEAIPEEEKTPEIYKKNLTYEDIDKGAVSINEFLHFTEKQNEKFSLFYYKTMSKLTTYNKQIKDKENFIKEVKKGDLGYKAQYDKLKKADRELEVLMRERDEFYNKSLEKFDSILTKKQSIRWELLQQMGYRFLPEFE